MRLIATLTIILVSIGWLSSGLPAPSADLDLIYPRFVGGGNLTCQGLTCGLTVRTRAAKYRLSKLELENRGPVVLTRNSDWSEPISPVFATIFCTQEGKEETYVGHGQDAEEFSKTVQTSLMKTSITTKIWVLLDSYMRASLDNSLYGGYRDDLLILCNKTSSKCHTEATNPFELYETRGDVVTNHVLPIVLNLFWAYENTNKINPFLVDAAGRIFKTSYDVAGEEGRPSLVLESVTNQIDPLEIKSRRLPKELKGRIDKDLELKRSSSYLKAVTPIFSSGSSNSSQIGLCYSSGYRKWKGSKPSKALECNMGGRNIMDQLPYSLTEDDTKRIAVHAMHMVTNGTKKYFHIVSTEVTKRVQGVAIKFDSNVRYEFCHSELGDTTKGSCTMEQIVMTPNDIVGYNDGGKCFKTISFYDRLYNVHNIDQKLTDFVPPQYLDNLNFYINAAFVLGTKFYFFTFSNTLVTVDGKMTDDCQKLSLDFNTAVVDDAGHQLIIQYALGKSIENVPFGDYMEWESGMNDTRPSVLNLKPVPNYTKPEDITTSTPSSTTTVDNTTAPNSEPNKKSSSLLTIIIGVIIAALIFAGLCYIFFFRSKPTEIQTPKKSRRNFDDLHSKTVRSSHLTSKIDSTKPASKIESLQSKKAPVPFSTKSPAKIGSKRSKRMASPSPNMIDSIQIKKASLTKSPNMVDSVQSSKATSPSSTKSPSRIDITQSKKTVSPSSTKSPSRIDITQSKKTISPSLTKSPSTSTKAKSPSTSAKAKSPSLKNTTSRKSPNPTGSPTLPDSHSIKLITRKN